jgi:hypothetical protein
MPPLHRGSWRSAATGILLCTAAFTIAAVPAAGQVTVYPIDAAPPAFQPSIDRSDLLIADIHGELLAQLHDKIDKGGPLLALRVCHSTAAQLARRIEAHDGIAAGFTSARLRQPANAPPAWASRIVSDYDGARAADVPGFLVDLGDRVGVLRPIVEQPLCAACHGPRQRIPDGVRKALDARYPADKATDIEDGQIRGWYWVTILKAKGPAAPR